MTKPEKRKELILKYRENYDKEGFKELILYDMNLFEGIIKKFENSGIEHDELINIAILGAFKVIKNINCEKNINDYSEFMYFYCSREILNEIKKQNKNVSYEHYTSQHKNGEDGYYTDTLFDDFINNTLYETIIEKLSFLSERDIDILISRYGLNYTKIKTLEELGKKYNLTHEGVRKIEINTLEKIRRLPKSKSIRYLLKD